VVCEIVIDPPCLPEPPLVPAAVVAAPEEDEHQAR
jgi:hypothetical protein